MILSDSTITRLCKEREIITPFIEEAVQPNSYDLHLGGDIIVFDSEGNSHKEMLPYTLKKGEFILATTLERVNIPKGIAAQVDGKSSIGRLGTLVHFTAGWIDTGFRGEITLEMYNVLRPLQLYKGMAIAQIIFMEAQFSKMYSGHYQDQSGATESWITHEKYRAA